MPVFSFIQSEYPKILTRKNSVFGDFSRTVRCLYSQPASACSKLTIETLEQEVKYVQVNNRDTRKTPMAVLVSLLLTLNILHTLLECFYC